MFYFNTLEKIWKKNGKKVVYLNLSLLRWIAAGHESVFDFWKKIGWKVHTAQYLKVLNEPYSLYVEAKIIIKILFSAIDQHIYKSRAEVASVAREIFKIEFWKKSFWFWNISNFLIKKNLAHSVYMSSFVI